jgi:CRISPR/Cas system-associated protein endoribonuclease Cas2
MTTYLSKRHFERFWLRRLLQSGFVLLRFDVEVQIAKDKKSKKMTENAEFI